MAARINNFPAYVVFDRSFRQTITPIYDSAPTYTGTTNYMIDSDLTTSYDINAISSATGVGFQIDYGKIYFNCQFSWKASFTKNNGAGSATWNVEHSTDAITWVVDDTGSVATGNTGTSTGAASALAIRYTRFRIAYTSLDLTTRVFESRLMGSSL